MWSTDTLWFDVAVVMTIFAVGNILFGRFEEHKPRPRRRIEGAHRRRGHGGVVGQVGRVWAYAVLMVPLLGAAYVHLVWLPRHGINGWTAEPRDRYLELLRRSRHSR